MKQRKLNKSQKNLFNKIKKGYDWDWAYLLFLEKTKLQNMSEEFATTQIFVGWEYVVSRINLCIKLIDIIINDTFEQRNVNFKNIHSFLPKYVDNLNISWLSGQLYTEKANNLYYELRKKHTRTWWC